MSTNDPARRGFLRTLAGAAAVSGASIGTAIPGSAAISTEPAVRAAVAAYQTALAAYDAAVVAHVDADIRHDDLGGDPQIPEAAFQRPSDLALGLTGYARYCRPGERARQYDIAQLRDWPASRSVRSCRPATRADGFSEAQVASGFHSIAYNVTEPWPEAQARVDEIVAASDEFEAEKTRRREVSGLREAAEAETKAARQLDDAGTALALAPSAGWEGLRMKAGVLLGMYTDVDQPADVFVSESLSYVESADLRLACAIAADVMRMVAAAGRIA